MEKYLPILGYEGLYEVSNYGNIRSLDKLQDFPLFTSGGTKKQEIISRLVKGKQMKTTLANNGYLVVGLYKDKKPYQKLVHRLVAETFIENPDNKLTVNHIDSNKQNNMVDNLEWATQKENVMHCIKKGVKCTMCKSKYCNNTKIDKEKILAAIEYRNQNMTYEKIGELLGENRKTISNIINKKSHKWINIQRKNKLYTSKNK